MSSMAELKRSLSPVYETRNRFFVDDAERAVREIAGQFYPKIPKDMLPLLAPRQTGVGFSGVKTDTSWALEKQVGTEGRDARPSILVGTHLPTDEMGNAFAQAGIFLAVGGHMMDSPSTHAEPQVIYTWTKNLATGQTNFFDDAGEKMSYAWDALDRVAACLSADKSGENLKSLARELKEELKDLASKPEKSKTS